MKLAHIPLLLLLTAAPLARAAEVPATQPTATQPAAGRPMEICFVLDTTGSMGGLIEGAKQKIWSIANDVITGKPKPSSIRIALVAYRDRGDVYVTKVFDLTDDIDTVYKNLQTFQADGGGDEPESVNQALNDAVEKVGWAKGNDALKVVFLVGDAPPHMDYADDVKYPVVCQKGVKRNLVFNTVQCGAIASTTPIWQDIARLGEGSFIQVGQAGDMVSVATPMDAELSQLNRRMGATLVPFGVAGALRPEAGAALAAKQAASEDAPAAVTADRLSYNLNSRKAVQGDDELLDAIESKRVAMKDLKDDQFPPDLRALSPADRAAKIEKLMAERAEIRGKIAEVSRRRDDYMAAEKRRRAASTTGDPFDGQVTKIIADEAARKAK